MSITWTPEDMLPRNFHSFSHEGILLGYDPLTGQGVRWIPRYARWNPITPGIANGGITRVNINGSMTRWHRLVAQYFINGGEPISAELDIDHIRHIDGTAYQDRLANLRIVTKRENMQNLKPRSSRYAGVHWDSHAGKWRVLARNSLTGNQQHIGLFADERVAADAYVDFCTQHGLACGPAIEALKLDETDYRQFN